MASAKRVTVKLVRDGAMCHIPVPFDPKAAFGKVRAPVKVTLNGYTYRSTIFAMGGVTFIPLRTSNREAAGLKGDETLAVTIALDSEPREIEPPEDLGRALQANARVWRVWQALSYTRRREHVEAVEGAKKPDTRARRIASIVDSLKR